MSIHGKSAITVPDGQEVELLEAVRTSGGDHKEFVKYLDSMIAKVIVGQTSTTDSGSWRGTANVHKDVRDEIIKADTDLLCGTFNAGPVKWLTEWNFPGAKPPKVWRVLDDDEDLDNRVKRDKTIYEMGFEPDPEYINSTYGGKWSKRNQSPTAPTSTDDNPSFAEADSDAIDRAIENGLTDWQPMMDPLLQPIIDMMEGAASFEEIQNKLPELYADMDVSQVTDKLQKLSFAIEVATRAGAEIDDGN